MNRKKAFKEDIGNPDLNRLVKSSWQYFKGTFYRKILRGNSRVQFTYGSSITAKSYPLHFHAELELMYIRQGPGAYYIAGKVYPFQKRLLLIAKPNDIHANMAVSLKGKVEKAVLLFPLGWMGRGLDVKSWPHEVLLSEDEAARFDLICWQVSEEVKSRRSGYEDMIRAKYHEICCLVRRIVTQPRKECANPLVDQLREYINQHFTEETSILNISKAFGYTKQYINLVFKKSTGLSLKRYILSRRVMEARMLLETKPEFKLAAIAEQVGFENYQMFYRIFKILTGVKPEAYRHVIQKAVAKKCDAD